jgi:hypothetical protein
MTDEIRIDEVLLNKALKLVNVGGEQEHRLLYHLINQIAEMGYRWRSEYIITLFDGDIEPNFDSKYAEYLDKKAQRQDVVWSNSDEEE